MKKITIYTFFLIAILFFLIAIFSFFNSYIIFLIIKSLPYFFHFYYFITKIKSFYIIKNENNNLCTL